MEPQRTEFGTITSVGTSRLSLDSKLFPETPAERLAAKLERQRIERESSPSKREILEREAQWWDPRRRT